MEDGIIKPNHMKKLSLFILLTMMGSSLFSQKLELIEDKDLIIERANAELDSAMAAPEGSIYQYALKHPVKGEYTYDISIWEKGAVTSIFAVGNNNGTIDSQNRLKDFLMTFKFNFKMPKGKIYKFRHTFTFN
jgi:hypothetical protein